MMLAQKFYFSEFHNRFASCQRLLEVIPENASVLSVCVNIQNMRYRSATNPHELHEMRSDTEKVTEWRTILVIALLVLISRKTIAVPTSLSYPTTKLICWYHF